MAHLKAPNPAAVGTACGAQEVDRFGGQIDILDSATLKALQANRIARRFGLTDCRARVVAELCFNRRAAA